MTRAAPKERLFDVGSVRLNVAIWEGSTGQPPIVLIHGIWDTWRIFTALGAMLAQDRTVYAPDLRGHGKSAKPSGPYDYPAYADDLRQLVEQLPGGQVDLLAYSMGVPVAAFVARKNPRIRKLVLEDPPLQPRERSRATAAKWLSVKALPFDQVVSVMRETYPTRAPELVEENARTLVQTADEALKAIANGEQDVDWPPNMRDVEAATLVLQADPQRGGLLTNENCERLLSFMARGELARFPGSGHSIHGERCADMHRVVEEFLRRT